MTNLLTPILDEYDRELAALNARHRARIGERITQAQAVIFAELAGVATAAKAAPHPRSKAKARRRVGK